MYTFSNWGVVSVSCETTIEFFKLNERTIDRAHFEWFSDMFLFFFILILFFSLSQVQLDSKWNAGRKKKIVFLNNLERATATTNKHTQRQINIDILKSQRKSLKTAVWMFLSITLVWYEDFNWLLCWFFFFLCCCCSGWFVLKTDAEKSSAA